MTTDGQPELGGGREAADRRPPKSLRRLVCLSVTHETATNDRLAELTPDDPQAAASSVKSHDRVTGCVVVATCNRIEVYASTRTDERSDIEAALEVARRILEQPADAREYTGLAVVEHLMRVACGLESAVLGEDQILGQVDDAFADGEAAGTAGGILSRVAEAAVRVGRTARAETDINDGTVSYGSAICRALRDGAGGPPERVLVVGAGEMATTAVEAIQARWQTRVDIANRTTPELAADVGACWPLSDIETPLSAVDGLVTATGASEPIVDAELASLCDPDTPAVDLANPPDVSEAARQRLLVTDLDDIADHVSRNAHERHTAIGEVERRIDDALGHLIDRERENRAEDTLRRLHRQARRTREAEIQRARSRLADGEVDPETVLEEFASALTGQLLAEPTESLRAAARGDDAETIAAAEQLFGLDADDSAASATATDDAGASLEAESLEK